MMTCGLTHLLRKSSGGHGWLHPPPLSKQSLRLYRLFNVFMDGGCNLLASEALSQVQWTLWDLAVCYFLEWAFLPIKSNPSDRQPSSKTPCPPPTLCVCVCFCCLRLTQKGWWQVCFGCYPFRKNVSPYLDFFIILITRFFFWKENQGTPVHAPYKQIIHWLNCAFDFYLTIMYKNYIPLQGIHKHKVFTCEIIKTMYRWTCTHTRICAHIVIHNHTMTYTHNCICFPL